MAPNFTTSLSAKHDGDHQTGKLNRRALAGYLETVADGVQYWVGYWHPWVASDWLLAQRGRGQHLGTSLGLWRSESANLSPGYLLKVDSCSLRAENSVKRLRFTDKTQKLAGCNTMEQQKSGQQVTSTCPRSWSSAKSREILLAVKVVTFRNWFLKATHSI